MKKEATHKTIPRRDAIQKITLGATSLSLSPAIFVREPKYKLVINHGKVFTGTEIKEVNVGITQTNKIKISKRRLKGEQALDATGKIVSPGFIDILGDNAGNPKATYQVFEKYKISDGLTTVLQMHGGAENTQNWYNHFEQVPHYVNYGVSTFVMRIRWATNSLEERLKKVEQCLEEGALGVSHSPEYQPNTSYEELKAYANLAQQYDRPLFLHLRYSSQEKELEGIQEAIDLAKETGVRVHINHLHSTGGTYNMPQALEMIQNANDSGLELTCCVYPYSYWATYSVSTRFAEGWREKYGLDYEDLTVVGTGETLTEESFQKYREQSGLLLAVPEGTMPMQETVNLALQKDFCMIGSDGGLHYEPRSNNHPRGAGCFATAIRHALDMGLPLEDMLAKMTALPAQLMRPCLNERGTLENGKIADITIFDPETIRGKASVANPNQFSEGIDTVIVNGEIAFQNQEIVASRGVGIRY